MTTSKELPENAEVVDTDDLQTDSANSRNQNGAPSEDGDEDVADEYIEEEDLTD